MKKLNHNLQKMTEQVDKHLIVNQQLQGSQKNPKKKTTKRKVAKIKYENAGNVVILETYK